MGDASPSLGSGAGLVQLPDGSWTLPANAPPPTPTPNLDQTMANLRAQQPTGQAAPATPAQPTQGLVPVIDVGSTPTAGAQPGELGSGYRPVNIGQSQQAGTAQTAAPVPVQPAQPAQPAPGATGGPASVPTAAPALADSTGLVKLPDGTYGLPTVAQPGRPTADAPARSGNPAPPPSLNELFPNQEVRSRSWYQDLADDVEGAMGSLTHGMSLGLDEILDPLTPAITDSLTTGKPFAQAYQDQVDKIRIKRENFEQRYPTLGMTTEVVGSVPATTMMSPLFKAVPEAATAAQRAYIMARNAAASATVGAGTGFTMTPGDISQRVEGAKQGAVVGGVMEPAAAVVGGTISALRRTVNPSAEIPRAVGQNLQKDFGGTTPNIQPAAVPSIPLTLPEATGSPEAASALDTLNAMQQAEMQRQISEQNTAATKALSGQAPGEPALHSPALAAGSRGPEEIAARGSRAGVEGVKGASKIMRSEERRRWNKPSLTDPNGISSASSKDAVAREVRTMRREEPGLEDAIQGSDALRRVMGQLNQMPDKTAANHLNKIASRFRAISRDGNESGDVREVAGRLADAVQDGMAKAPEVVGRPPATQQELEQSQQVIDAHDAAARRQLASQPMQPPPKRPETLTEFLHSKGGIQPDADFKANDLDQHGVWRNVRGKNVQISIMRKSGLHWDKALEAASQGGDQFLPPGASKDDLIDALKSEQGGTPVYRQEDEAAGQYWREADAAANRQAQLKEQAVADVQETAEQMGQRLSPVEAEHAAQLIADDPHMTAQEAIEEAARDGEEKILQDNANRLAFSPPGVPSSTYQAPLPDMKTLREGIKPNPRLQRDLEDARKFTMQKNQLLGHASFDAIVNRNQRGNETVTPGTALSKFYDFANGVERPGDIKNVSRFLDDIRSEWLKLSQEERAGNFDPRDIDAAQAQLEDGARNYIFGKMMDAITNATPDMEGNRMIQWRQAANWLDTNRSMLESTGLFTPEQLGLLDRFRDTANQIAIAKNLARTSGSATFGRLVHPVRFVDALLGPISGRLMSAAGAAALGAFATHFFGEAAIGAMIGAEIGGVGGNSLISRLYATPREKLLQKLGEAYRNPNIARDLMQNLDNPRPSMSADTAQWLRSLLAADVPGQAARTLTDEPARQPEMAQ